MLLREFTVDDHVIELIQDGAIYIAKITNSGGEKVFYHEYNDYDKIKLGLDAIIERVSKNEVRINDIITILEKSMA